VTDTSLTLGQKQRLFPLLVTALIKQIYTLGLEMTFGETYRTPEQAALNEKRGLGIANSLHIKRLAIDINLFKDGIYLTNCDDYAVLGTFWKSLHPLARWGGDFTNLKDGGHFSLEHEGVK